MRKCNLNFLKFFYQRPFNYNANTKRNASFNLCFIQKSNYLKKDMF